MKLFKWQSFQFAILIIVILSIYGHTLDVPFYVDDYSSIIENQVIQHFDLRRVFWSAPLRFIGNLSFAINFYFHDNWIAPYHIVNIVIHFLASIAVFFLVQGIIQLPKDNNSTSVSGLFNFLPFITALFFAIHPLQTQAVSYIVQRFASMAAFFYLSSLASYVHYRLSDNRNHKICLITCFIVFGFLSFLTKQNTATLPLAVLLIEWLFFKNKKRLLYIFSAIFFCLFLLLISLYCFPVLQRILAIYSKLGSNLPHHEYFFTQVIVVWIYIIKFIIPCCIHFDYDIQVITTVFQATFILAFLGHFILIIFAFFIRKSNPFIAFCILFYYLAHIVESGLIPITDLCFEHRTYLPNLGMCMLMSRILIGLINTRFDFGITILVCIAMLFSITTYKRNQVWKDPDAFWRNNIQYSPNKVRPWSELGKYLLLKKKFNEASEAFTRAIELSPSDKFENKLISVPVIANLIIVLHHEGKTKEALKLAQISLKYPMNRINGYYILNTIGNIYLENNDFQEAEKWYRLAINLMPDNSLAMIGLANTLKMLGKTSEAQTFLNQIEKLENKNKYMNNRLYYKK